MRNFKVVQCIAIGLVAVIFTGCENLPGTKGQQGAVIGGATGAATGAVIGGEEHRGLGAILGGVLGAAGGYVLGANSDKILNKDANEAESAARRAQTNPATADQARTARTADVNADGYVTLDEVSAMRDAGISDEQMLRRLEATGQVFELTEEGKRILRERGVSEYVITQMQALNPQRRQTLMQQLSR
ncbi:MAG TPA: glycine zipper domain-containing protein [Candidatus Acidoferrum sp.]|nr:glycine zipper domain-containing protein [Candidatus Acidoferrum sp.]